MPYALMREDDNGVVHLVKGDLTEEEAEALERDYLAKKPHKQLYFVDYFPTEEEIAALEAELENARKEQEKS
jgi:hypothetical protein